MDTREWAAQLFKITPRATPDDFPSVVLDFDAIQKFAEIRVLWDFNNADSSTVLIRGLASAERHWDAAASTFHRLQDAFVFPKIIGGGRIKHDSASRTILVYGSSMEYGQADLERVAALCRESYPDYDVSYCQPGY